MKKIILPLIALSIMIFSSAALLTPVQAQSSPPISPDEAWQPPFDGGENVAPSVGVENYNQSWSSLQVSPPSPVAPGVDSSIITAYLVNSRGQIVYNLYGNDLVYLLVSFNGPGYFYLWEYYPSGSPTYGHWLCYRWYRPYAGVWKIGPFAPQSGDPAGRYVWKLWFLSNYSWSTRTLSFDYVKGYYPPDIPRTPTTYYPPVINSFITNLPTIELGATATLTWTTSNASTVTISPGIGTVAASGSTTVSPTATTVYTLSASGTSSSPVSSSVTVTVTPRIPPTLSVDRATIQSGESATLSWNAPAAKQVFITGVGNSGSTGTALVTPDKTAIYSLTATYIDGSTLSTSVTVNVQQPPYLIYGMAALLVLAVVAIIAMAARRPAKALQPQQARTRAASSPAEATTPAIATVPSESTAPSEATTPAGTTPGNTALLEMSSAKLSLPDGGEILLAGNARSFGRRDFNKFLKPEQVSYVSRQHFSIWYEDGMYYIEDRGSTNGTMVNGTEIKGTGRHALVDGDTIELAGKLPISFKK